MQVGVCVPLVPEEVYAQYIEECREMRYQASIRRENVEALDARLFEARLTLAPTGAAVGGLCRRLKLGTKQVRPKLAESLFNQPTGSIAAHFPLSNALTV